MRIVSGEFGSRSVKTLKGDTTRPTSDKIRGAIFNRIGPYFEEGSFLDLFGGSGAMSIEAISRGFTHATLFEKNPKAYQKILENIKDFNIEDKTKLRKGDTLNLVQQLTTPFDYVYVDPPYGYKSLDEIIEILGEKSLVNTCLMVETGPETDLKETKYFKLSKILDYKATKVYFYEPII